MNDSAQVRNSYDEVPYASWPYPQSHPARLATIATLFGMQPQPVDRARVLELGCASGGNLIPMAEMFPESSFVGIDLSSRQVADGASHVKALDLRNIELRHGDISSLGAEIGKFHYILCHGVYSWVPDVVKAHILSIAKANLEPNGVAYVSYNTYPGWRMRSMLRDMMSFHSERFESPKEKVAQARGLLGFLGQAVTTQGGIYGAFLKQEVETFKHLSDHYLYHEYLEEVNEPTYFFEFSQRAQSHGLQYLGESDFGSMSASNFPREVELTLQRVAPNLIQMEQYMDFLRNRTFRQTLLCHADVLLDRSLNPQFLQKLYVASDLESETPEADLRAATPVAYKKVDMTVNTATPLFKAALRVLKKAWPRAIPFETLLASSRALLNPDPVLDASRVAHEVQVLGEHLLQCYSRGAVELTAAPSRFEATISSRPKATSIARAQAEKQTAVVNRRHELIQLNDVARHLIRFLDGNRTTQQVLEELLRLVADQKLIVHDEGAPASDRARAKVILEQAMNRGLEHLARHALLVA